MNFSDTATLFSDAAAKLRKLPQRLRGTDLHSAAAMAEERLHDVMASVDDLIGALGKSVAQLRHSAAPYLAQVADTATSQAEAVRDNLASGARVVGQMVKPRGAIGRHPYLFAFAAAGVCYVAIANWRRMARRTTTSARRRVAAKARGNTRPAAARMRREKRQRSGTPSTRSETPPKAVH